MGLERIAIGGDSVRAYWGLFLGSLATFVAIGGAIFLGYIGNNTGAAILVSSSASTLIGGLAIAYNKRRHELDSKKKTETNKKKPNEARH